MNQLTCGKRNRFSKDDDLETIIKKLQGQIDAKERWRYTRQARQKRFFLALLKFVRGVIEEPGHCKISSEDRTTNMLHEQKKG